MHVKKLSIKCLYVKQLFGLTGYQYIERSLFYLWLLYEYFFGENIEVNWYTLHFFNLWMDTLFEKNSEKLVSDFALWTAFFYFIFF